MDYHGYSIEPKWLSSVGINWETTGNGTFVTAKKGSNRYFLKRSISVRFPSSKLPKASYDLQLVEFKKVRDKQTAIKKKFASLTVSKNHIVPEVDHFVDESNYFVTVTPFIEGLIGFDKLLLPTTASKIALAVAMAEDIKTIHALDVIHGDLKPQHFGFVKAGSTYIPLLLDFDNSFIDGNVPDYESLGGTEGYQPPEAIGYIEGEDGYDEKSITKASDIFSLAITIHHILFGELPSVTGARDVGNALLYGKEFSFHKAAHMQIGSKHKVDFYTLLMGMTELDYKKRPTIEQVIAILKDKASFEGEYHEDEEVEKEEAPYFDFNLWEEDTTKGVLLGESVFKSKGYEGFHKEELGSVHSYSLIKEGVTESVTFDRLVELGLVKKIEKAVSITLDEPYPGDNIEFLSAKELSDMGVEYIKRSPSIFRKIYRISVNGLSYDINKKMLLTKGFARLASVKGDDGEVTPFPEDGKAFNTDNLARRGIEKIERFKRDGQNYYRLTYKDGRKQEMTSKLAILSGYILK